MSPETHDFYDFEDFRLDRAERALTRGGKYIPVTPKVYETLVVLIENAGHIIEKDELMRKIWQDRFVEESNLTFNIKMLRKALGDDAAHPRYIETVPRRGYRFIADVRRVETDAKTAGQSDDEREINLSAGSSSYRPIVPSSRRQSANGAVVALADWRHEAKGNEAAQFSPTTASVESIEQIAAAELIPAKLNGESKLASTYRLPLAAFALAAVLIGAIGLGFYYFSTGKSAAGADGTKSIAVLPLKPISAAMRDEIYEVGIADSLIHRLSSMKGFVVRPLSATRKYADIAQDALAAGREQQTDYILASNYQLANGKIRITTQLFNVASGQIEDTYKSEKDAGDIFAMQDQIAGEVGNLLQKRFATTSSNAAAKRGTTNEEAYRLYLQGIYLIEKMGYANAKRAIELFDEALALDPNYAQAWAGKAWAHCYFSHVGGNSPDEQYTQAKPAIERAFALDPNLPEAYAVLGVIKIDYDWNFADGEKQFLRAIEISPTSDIAHAWYANRLAAREGRIEEAIALIKTAVDLNPNNVIHQIRYGRTLYLARRYDEAITQLQRAGEMDPAHPYVHGVLWRSYDMKGDDARAYESFIRQQQLLKTNDETLRSYETAYTKSGWQGVLLRHLEIMKEKSIPADAYYLATLSALVGQPEQSFRYLDDAVKNRSGDIPDIVSNPAFDSLRGDSRFNELIERAGLK